MTETNDAAVGHRLGTPMVCSCVYPTHHEVEEMRAALREVLPAGAEPSDLAVMFMAETFVERDGCPMHAGRSGRDG